MCKICSNTDGSKPVFFYMTIINNAFIMFIPTFCWGYNRTDDPLKIPYTGIPFVLLVRHQYQCHQGKDIKYKKKENCKEKKNAKLITDHAFTKHENVVQDTKKGCLIVSNTKKLLSFPKYKIPTDARYNRDNAEKINKKNHFMHRTVKGPKRKGFG